MELQERGDGEMHADLGGVGERESSMEGERGKGGMMREMEGRGTDGRMAREGRVRGDPGVLSKLLFPAMLLPCWPGLHWHTHLD